MSKEIKRYRYGKVARIINFFRKKIRRHRGFLFEDIYVIENAFVSKEDLK